MQAVGTGRRRRGRKSHKNRQWSQRRPAWLGVRGFRSDRSLEECDDYLGAGRIGMGLLDGRTGAGNLCAAMRAGLPQCATDRRIAPAGRAHRIGCVPGSRFAHRSRGRPSPVRHPMRIRGRLYGPRWAGGSDPVDPHQCDPV